MAKKTKKEKAIEKKRDKETYKHIFNSRTNFNGSFDDNIKWVRIYRGDNPIKTCNNLDELSGFIANLRANNRNPTSYSYEFDTKEKDKNKIDNIWHRLSNSIKQSGKNRGSPKLELGGDAGRIWGGGEYYKPGKPLKEKGKSSYLNDGINFLDNNKKSILKDINDKDLVELAKKENPSQYYKFLRKNDLPIEEEKDINEKARKLRNEIEGRTIDKSTKGKKGWLNRTVFRVFDQNKDFKQSIIKEGNVPFAAVQQAEKKLGKKKKVTAKDIEQAREKAMLRDLKSDLTSTKQRKFLSDFKDFAKNRHRQIKNDADAAAFLKSPEGENEFYDFVREKLKKGEIRSVKKGNDLLKKFNVSHRLNPQEQKIKGVASDSEKKHLIARMYGYSDTNTNARYKPFVKLLFGKFKGNRDAMGALDDANLDQLRDHQPNSIDYNDLHAAYDGKVWKNKRDLVRLEEHGTHITGAPSKLREYLNEKVGGSTDRPSGSKKSYSSGGSKTYSKSSRGRGRPRKSSSKGLWGSKEIKYKDGRPILVKHKGKLSGWASDKKDSVKKIFSGKERKKSKRKKIRERYEEYKDRDDLQYLTKEEKKYAAQSNPISRWLVERKGKKMWADKSYRDKKAAKRTYRESKYEAKLKQATKMAERRKRAAESPWWRVWYTLTHNVWVLIGVALAISLLFLPIGLFYVLGWAIAVGMVTLVMYVIWVFMEIWWLIAQGLTALINLVGQSIVGAINYVGRTIASPLGFTFNNFQHTLIRNMQIAQINAETGEREILGMTWGEWNLVPPDFLKLNEFMPKEFDTDVLIVKVWPALADFFNWYTQPIADRYTEWISSAPWYHIGAMIGLPIVLIIIGGVLAIGYIRRKMV